MEAHACRPGSRALRAASPQGSGGDMARGARPLYWLRLARSCRPTTGVSRERSTTCTRTRLAPAPQCWSGPLFHRLRSGDASTSPRCMGRPTRGLPYLAVPLTPVGLHGPNLAPSRTRRFGRVAPQRHQPFPGVRTHPCYDAARRSGSRSVAEGSRSKAQSRFDVLPAGRPPAGA